MPTVNCENCQGRNISCADGLRLICLDCGHRLAEYRESSELGFTQLPRFLKKTRALGRSWEQDVRQATSADAGPRRLCKPPTLYIRSSELILRGFQALLKAQARALAESLRRPCPALAAAACADAPCSAEPWERLLVRGLGGVWARLLRWWLREGWGSARPAGVRPLDKALAMFGESRCGVVTLKKVPFEKKIHCRKVPFTLKPRAINVFRQKRAKEQPLPYLTLPPGGLSMELSLALLHLAALSLNLPLPLSELVLMAKRNVLPYFDARGCVPPAVLREMNTVQFSDTSFVSNFFTPRKVPSAFRVEKYAKAVAEAVGMDLGVFTPRHCWAQATLLRLSRNMNLPSKIFKVAANLSRFWRVKAVGLTNSIEMQTTWHYVAHLLVATKMLVRFDDTEDIFDDFDSTCETTKNRIFAVNAIIDSLPQPDGSEFHRGSVVAALTGSRKPSAPALAHQSAATAERTRQALKRLVAAAPAREGANARSYATYPRGNQPSLHYGRLLAAAATLADCTADLLHGRVLGLETRLANVEKVLAAEARGRLARGKPRKAEEWIERVAAKRAHLKADGRVEDSGPLRFARRWRNREGMPFYDCVCGAMGPNKMLEGIKYHWMTKYCLLEDD